MVNELLNGEKANFERKEFQEELYSLLVAKT